MSQENQIWMARSGRAENDLAEDQSYVKRMGARRDMLLIVGGYGAVGARLSRELVSAGEQVIVAGRVLERARKVALELHASARRIDLQDNTTWTAACEGVTCVIVCMDQSDTAFVRFVLERGIHYVDFTASDSFFRQIEVIESPTASALLSVGLAPGLTNLLAAHCAKGMDQVLDVEIGLMSAIGDTHGHAGISWLMDQVFDASKQSDGKRVDFGKVWGERMAYRVDFADQHVMRRHLGSCTTATRVCLTSAFVTSVLFRLVGVFRGNIWVKRALSRVLSIAQWGDGACVIAVAVTGIHDGSLVNTHARFTGTGELEITAKVGAEMIRTFLLDPPGAGVWHSHQVLNLTHLSESDAVRSAGLLELGRTEDISGNHQRAKEP